MPDLPAGTVTFLLTDVEGSTRLWERDPDAMRTALARHDELFEDLIRRHNGVPVKPRGEGDSRFAVFARATDAVAAAVAIQQALHAEAWPAPTPLKVRIALHTGEADVRDGDYYGGAVNRCARLRSVAHGGQTLLSQTTYDLVRHAPSEDVVLRDLGEHRLADLTIPEHVFQATHPALPADFPPPISLDAYHHNLPLQLTSFVGRERAIAAVTQLLDAGRLVTLTGTGGCGKTRLALQVVADRLDLYPDGVWLVELEPLADPALVPQAVASVLGIREVAGVPLLQTLADRLHSKRLVLLLDNCEHLIDAAAALADVLTRRCLSLRLLATSRERLGVPGEHVWPVPPMASPHIRELSPATPVPVSLIGDYEAVRLFVERARLVAPAFALTDLNARPVAQICQLLDGIPLALELAAARVRILSAEQILARLHDRFKLLTGGSRTSPRRQQTLRAAIDWSYNLLTEPERVVARRLAVFAGGFTLDAAEEICADEGAAGPGGAKRSSEIADPLSPPVAEDVEVTDFRAIPHPSPDTAHVPPVPSPIRRGQVLDLVAALADKSIVAAEDVGGEVRYRLLETIRQYLDEKLRAGGEAARVRDRHRDWYAALAERIAPELFGPGEVAGFARLTAEHDNLRAALAWCDQRDAEAGLRLAVALGHFWESRGNEAEGRRWIETMLARASTDPLPRVQALWRIATWLRHQGDVPGATARAEEGLLLAREAGSVAEDGAMLTLLGSLAAAQGDFDRARPLLADGLGLTRQAGDALLTLWSLRKVGELAWYEGRTAEARAAFEEQLAIGRDLGYGWGIADALWGLGVVAKSSGDWTRAEDLLRDSLARFRAIGDKPGLGFALRYLGYLVGSMGRFREGEAFLREGVRLHREVGHVGRVARSLCFLGILALRQGHVARGVHLVAAAEAANRFLPTTLAPDERGDVDAGLASARAALGEEAFRQAWSVGQATPLEQVVAFALEEQGF